MQGKIAYILIILNFFINGIAFAEHEHHKHIVIGTGNLAGLYYPTGGAICTMLKNAAVKTSSKINCDVKVTAGSIDNINELRAGNLDFAIVQSDWQFQAFHGSEEFVNKTPFRSLRALFSIYGEPFTIVVRADSPIISLSDLKGRRVNIGVKGSGQRATMNTIMHALNWEPNTFRSMVELNPKDQVKSLCDKKIDAIVYTMGHPNNMVTEAALTCSVRLVSASGTEIKRLTLSNPYFVPMTIPGKMYKGNLLPIPTFGVQATLVTTVEEPNWVVYTVVKSVFDRLKIFKNLYPAFAGINAHKMLLANSAPYATGAMIYFKQQHLLVDIAD